MQRVPGPCGLVSVGLRPFRTSWDRSCFSGAEGADGHQLSFPTGVVTVPPSADGVA